jgi:hypothetical protein
MLLDHLNLLVDNVQLYEMDYNLHDAHQFGYVMENELENNLLIFFFSSLLK